MIGKVIILLPKINPVFAVFCYTFYNQVLLLMNIPQNQLYFNFLYRNCTIILSEPGEITASAEVYNCTLITTDTRLIAGAGSYAVFPNQ